MPRMAVASLTNPKAWVSCVLRETACHKGAIVLRLSRERAPPSGVGQGFHSLRADKDSTCYALHSCRKAFGDHATRERPNADY